MMIGVDIGGTFTDTVLFNEETGDYEIFKVSTTPENPATGVEESIRQAISKGMKPEEVTYIAHACTIATNAIIEKKGAKAALFTTEGFEDVLELGRLRRPDPYDFLQDIPEPLVPRYLIKPVSERINSKGEIVRELDTQKVLTEIKEVKEAGIEAIAISFLFSFLNPIHEQAVKKIIEEELPDIHITLSAELIPQFREYERTSTTVVNAYVAPIVSNYIASLESSLKRLGILPELYIMGSSGGVMSPEMAKSKPAYLIESGPAAGVVEAAYLGKQTGYDNIITFDMGGTTAKMGLVEDGSPKVASDYEVGAIAQAGRRLGGSGYPLKLPVIDLVEMGAGGGSIAWIDLGGMMRVGPQSAGAVPGPACYDIGGTEPTVTDANLLLGYIDPDYFLGGKMRLRVDNSHKAIKEKIADPMGIGIIEAARGIIDISNANMIRGLKVVTTGRGVDPREFIMMAFGGAGPGCAVELAAELGIPKVLIPETAGVHSALGLLSTDIRHDFAITRKEKSEKVNLRALNDSYEEFEDAAQNIMLGENISPEKMFFVRSADMRYVGQSYEVSVPVPSEEIDEKKLRSLVQSFHDTHMRIYAHAMPGEPVEIVTLRCAAFGVTLKPEVARYEKGEESAEKALKFEREMFSKDYGDFVRCPCYDRQKLFPGNLIKGPAIIEQIDTTIVIPPNYQGQMDEYRNILISCEE